MPVTQTVSWHLSAELGALQGSGLGFLGKQSSNCHPPSVVLGSQAKQSARLKELSGSGEGWCFTTPSGECSKGQMSEIPRSLSFVFRQGQVL